MADTELAQQKKELDAIDAIVQEGARRHRARSLKAILFAVALAVVGIPAIYYLFYLPDLHKVPVAVLLPCTDEACPDEMGRNKVADNAARQLEGFSQAFTDASIKEGNQHIHHFAYPVERPAFTAHSCKSPSERPYSRDLADIHCQMEDWYNEGIRIFIITMSGAVKEVKEGFIRWSETLPENDRPVLIATVASAPTTNNKPLANRAKGVLRHYIRSQDESSVFSSFIEAKQPNQVRVFYFDDTYGKEAERDIRNRLERLKQGLITRDSSLVKPGSERQKVLEWMERSDFDPDAVVVVIGYGSMIKNTLKALRTETVKTDLGERRFNGTVLVASTYTECKWRLDSEVGASEKCLDKRSGQMDEFHKRIYTVGPGGRVDDEQQRGVVYQFSYLTLDRALKCADARGVDMFWECWSDTRETKPSARGADWQATVEFTASGDSHVSLQLLNHEQW